MNVTLGSDPELHLMDNEKGRIVSSLSVLKKDKREPISLGRGRNIYADNVLIEASFDPASSTKEMLSSMRDLWGDIQKYLTPRYSLVPKAAHVYDPCELEDKSLWEAGCNPNYNVYTGEQNEPAKFTDGLRTGSFHVHVGHPLVQSRQTKEHLVKLLDIYLGCASVIFDKDETSPSRRALYGRAGEFRPTPYGIEYRVLGNYALRSPILTELVWDLVNHSVERFNEGESFELIEAIGSERPQRAINNHNPKLAEEVMEIASIPVSLMDRIKQTITVPSFNEAWAI